jgi:hypothetical protein
MSGEHEAGLRPRKAGKDQTRHHREKAHAGENLDGSDEMTVIGLRMHIAITNGGQCLDRKIEQAQG